MFFCRVFRARSSKNLMPGGGEMSRHMPAHKPAGTCYQPTHNFTFIMDTYSLCD